MLKATALPLPATGQVASRQNAHATKLAYQKTVGLADPEEGVSP